MRQGHWVAPVARTLIGYYGIGKGPDMELRPKFMPIVEGARTQNQQRITDNRELSGVPFDLLDATFLSFKPKTSEEQVLLRHIWTYVNNFQGSGGDICILPGAAPKRRTYLGVAAGNAFLDAGFSVLYRSLDRVLPHMPSKRPEGRVPSVLSMYTIVDLLILDDALDLKDERVLARFYNLLSSRSRFHKPTLVLTTLSSDRFSRFLDDRVYRRRIRS